MQRSITQNDQLAVTYRFVIDRHYENLDLGDLGWEWSMAWKNSLDIPNAVLLESVVDENKVYVDWTPNWPETASAGLFEFQIRAKKDDTDTGELLKWNTQIAHIDFNPAVALGQIDRGILEDYLDKFMQLCSTATIDAEQQRAIAAELALTQEINDLSSRIISQLEIISNHIDQVASDLEAFDTKQISHYSEPHTDTGRVSNQDSLDEALAKLQWQIDHMSIGGVLPVSKGGTGTSSFDPGILMTNGGQLPIRTVDGNVGEVLTKVQGGFQFRKLSTEDMSDYSSLLWFRDLKSADIDVSRFLE